MGTTTHTTMNLDLLEREHERVNHVLKVKVAEAIRRRERGFEQSPDLVALGKRATELRGVLEGVKPKESFTLQRVSESGSFSMPSGRDLIWVYTMKEAASIHQKWMREHERVGADPSAARVLVWKGHLDDVSDAYPSFMLRRAKGKRGWTLVEDC